jgi:hypothetical protein
MPNELGKVRRSQNLGTYGPGAIIDFRSGSKDGAPVSAVAAGLELWDQEAPPAWPLNEQTTFEPRLQEKLGVDGFRLPPVAPEFAPGRVRRSAPHLTGIRFPAWLQCPQCHLLQPASKWDGQPGEAGRYCGTCTSKAPGRRRVYVIPVRFVSACERGHLDEFPWNWWVRHKTPGCNGKLYLTTEGGAGLAGLIVSCASCGARETMAGATSKNALRGSGTCRGRTPWLPREPQPCDRIPRAFQRGASNLYFPVIASALDIPPFADQIQHRLGLHWEKLRKKVTSEERRQFLEINELHVDTGIPIDRLHEEVERRIAAIGKGGLATIRDEEYRQFIEDPPVKLGEKAEFEVRRKKVPGELTATIRSLVQATRLREVRALRAFTRVYPPDPADAGGGAAWAPIAARRKKWLPAIEVKGEGIFIELQDARLQAWERNHPEVLRLAAKIDEAYALDWHQRNGSGTRPPRTISARYLLVHSLAHALIRQLGVDCGYSTSSLRERLYVGGADQNMAGLLIYTSTADSDGTLGGLASQAETDRFIRMFEAAIAAVRWCSSDPLCGAGVHAFTEPTNGAACHACMLAPETSCEEFNRLLDRRMLVGTPECPEMGFFSDLL